MWQDIVNDFFVIKDLSEYWSAFLNMQEKLVSFFLNEKFISNQSDYSHALSMVEGERKIQQGVDHL